MREGLRKRRGLSFVLTGALLLTGCGNSVEAAGSRPDAPEDVEIIGSAYEPITNKELAADVETTGYDAIAYVDTNGAMGVQGVVTSLNPSLNPDEQMAYEEGVADSACGSDLSGNGKLEASEVKTGTVEKEDAVHQEFLCTDASATDYFSQDVIDVRLELQAVSSNPAPASVYELTQRIISTDDNNPLKGWVTEEGDVLVGQNCVSSSSAEGYLEGSSRSGGGGVLLGPVGVAGGGSSGSINGEFSAESASNCAGVTTARVGVSYNQVDDGAKSPLSFEAKGNAISAAELSRLEAGFKDPVRGLEPGRWDTKELPKCEFFTTGEGKGKEYRAKYVGGTCIRHTGTEPVFTGVFAVEGMTNEKGDPLCMTTEVTMVAASEKVSVRPTYPDRVISGFIPVVDPKVVNAC